MERVDLVLSKLDRAADRALALAQVTSLKRQPYANLETSLLAFIGQDKPQSRWIIMPGLRGVGKTTLLAQLYNHPKLADQPDKFYLSLDNPTVRSIGYNDLTAAIEQRIGRQLHRVERPVFILIDEVHFWPGNWSADLKFLYDSCPNLFLATTGSSALHLHLNLNPDSARRADIVRIPPLSLTESISFRQPAGRQLSSTDLPDKLAQALFESNDARQAYDRIEALESEIGDCWQDLLGQKTQPASEDIIGVWVENYINHCLTLPVAAANLDGAESIKAAAVSQIRTRVNDTLGLVLERDLEIIRDFDLKTRRSIFEFLLLLAHSDTISLNKIADDLSDGLGSRLSLDTIRAILHSLKQVEVLLEIPAWGSSFGRITKPAKYLFAAPALRSALSPLSDERTEADRKSGNFQLDQLRGRLLEDTVGMYLKRRLLDCSPPGQLAYDARSGGADFIASQTTDRRRTIVIEVGWGKSDHRQINQTRKRLKSTDYGLVISGRLKQPKLNQKDQVIYLPLSTFLLL